MFKQFNKEDGFMGKTHALSAVAVWLLIAAFLPDTMFNTILKSDNLIVFITSIVIVTGFGLMPDFDNTKSTAISTLGLLGRLLSMGMRTSSLAIQSSIKGPADKSTSNPHRGFWHTLISSLLIGLIVYTTTSIPIKISDAFTVGLLFAIMWAYICLKIGLAGLFNQTIKKIKSQGFLSMLVIELLAILFSITLIFLLPKDLSYNWFALSATLGYCIHILGDTVTTSGTPLLFPLKHKGKRWWNYRLTSMKANGPTENLILIPVFIGIIIFSLLKIYFT